jgi:DNA primase catalytic core
MKETLKQRILDAVPIDQYIGRTVALKKQGRYLKGLCPFHNEKTPSFTVTPEKGIYHCFGCGRSGDLFGFVMEKEGVSFPEAVEILASYAGIEIPGPHLEEKGREGGREKACLDLLSEARSLYQEYLHSADGQRAMKYLVGRGIRPETIEAFHIGAAPPDWRFLTDRYSGKEDLLMEAGLARKSDSGRLYDFFRDRILFPIEDLADRCLGFGGRVIRPEDQPKYINSPDSALFHKGRILYGLNRALPALRKNRRAILVEGYLDVIGLYEAGIHGAVAPLGTAFTEDHRSLIARYADELILFLDGDEAGRAAATRAARTLLAGNLTARVLFLPRGADPFDFSRIQDAVSVFEDMVEKAVPAYRFLLLAILEGERLAGVFAEDLPWVEYMDFIWQSMQREEAHRRMSGIGLDAKKQAFIRLTALLNELNDLDSRFLQDEAGQILGVDPAAIRSAVHRAPASPVTDRRHVTGSSRGGETHLVRIERELMAYLFLNPGLFPAVHKALGDLVFEDPASETLWRILENRSLSGNPWTGDPAEMAEFPAAVRDPFLPIVLKLRESKTDKISREILLELSIKHSLERLERELKKKESEIQFAEDPGPLVRDMHDLQKEKIRLKSLLRSGV